MSLDYQVKDLALAQAGRHQIRLAEHEMPGLMALRAEYAASQPLAGALIAGSLHMTVQTAVLIETLVALGARVRWASCNIYSTQDEAAAAVVVGPQGTPEDPQGVPVFAWKGETLQEYWDCTEQILSWPGGEFANMILDDGGDATMLVHKGREWETAGQVPPTTDEDSHEFGVFKALVRRTMATDPRRWTTVSDHIKGVTEETTTGVHRLYQLAEAGELLFPAINVNDSVTKSKFGQGARVIVTEIDPICALQAAMDGYQVARMDDVVGQADIFVTATGCFDVITADHMAAMKNKAIVSNIGHFDNEIDMAGLERTPGITKTEIKPQVHEWTFPDGTSIIVLSEGRLMNLGNATGHPSFVMSNSFSNQTIAQVEMFTNTTHYRDEDGNPQVETLPKHLDEKVARLHLEALGADLTELSKEQAEYLGVDVAGPYKPEHYRY